MIEIASETAYATSYFAFLHLKMRSEYIAMLHITSGFSYM